MRTNKQKIFCVFVVPYWDSVIGHLQVVNVKD